jgi:hypothetical protein
VNIGGNEVFENALTIAAYASREIALRSHEHGF